MIKDHVSLDGIDGQEVHHFYTGLDAKKESFNKFMRKAQNRTITGNEIRFFCALIVTDY